MPLNKAVVKSEIGGGGFFGNTLYIYIPLYFVSIEHSNLCFSQKCDKMQA